MLGISVIPPWAKLAIVAGALAASFAAGWRVKGAFVAERDLANIEAKNEMVNVFRSMEGGIAKTVEDKLSSLKTNERVIEREKLKIVDRPVYLNNCLDADGLRLVERARKGTSDTANPAGEVPATK